MIKEDGRRSPDEARTEEKSIFDGLEGVYVGFSPTDESAVLMGEIEFTITKDTVRMRTATGLELKKEESEISELGVTEMSETELRELLADPSAASEIRGFKLGAEPWLIVSTVEDDDDTPAARLLMGEMGETLGPTVLFSPKQLRRGLLYDAINAIEQNFGRKDVIPRLSNQGKALSWFTDIA